MTLREKWNIGLTPEVGTSDATQRALDWWHNLPVQDIQNGNGWANLCMVYFPDRTECYHFTEDEVLYMYKQEHK